MVHASSRSKKVTVTNINEPYYVKRYIGAVRLPETPSVISTEEFDSSLQIKTFVIVPWISKTRYKSPMNWATTIDDATLQDKDVVPGTHCGRRPMQWVVSAKRYLQAK